MTASLMPSSAESGSSKDRAEGGSSKDHAKGGALPILITMGTKILSCGAPTFVVVAEITNKYQVGIHASGNEYRNSSGRDPHILQKVIAV